MKLKLYFLAIFLATFCQALVAQNCDPDCEIWCPVSEECINICSECNKVVSADNCADARTPSIAELDGFSVQSCAFTPDGPGALPGFCGPNTIIHNNFWIGFTPTNSGMIHLNIEIINCLSPNAQCSGVQAAVCRALCKNPGNEFFGFEYETLACVNCVDQTFDLISNDAIEGVPHYIMIDGCCGDICEMVINIIDDGLLDRNIYSNSSNDLEVFVDGGQAPYTISWDDGTEGVILKDPIPNTMYTASIQDAKGDTRCISSGVLNANVNNDFDVILNPTEVMANCAFISDPFTISASAPGVNNPTFEWLDNQGNYLGNGPSFTGYLFEVAQVKVTNPANGQQASKNIPYNSSQEDAQIELPDLYLSCNQTEISLPVHQTYMTTWYDADGVLLPNNIASAPGIYNAIIVNTSNGCEFYETIEILALPAPMIDLIGTNVTCFGAMDGSIEVDIDVVGQSVIFEWMGSGSPITNINLNELAAGDYSLTITDENGCTAEASVSIEEPEELVGTLIPNGSNLETSLNGGVPPYIYLWNDGNTGSSYNNALANTNYSVTVTDANGCELVLEGSILTSVFALDKTELKISCFPNPTGGLINVQTESKREWTYKLYNLQGQLLLTANANDHQANIDLTSLQAGLYYLYLEMEDGVYVEKVVKE